MVSNRIIKIDLNKKTKNVVQMVQGDTNRKLTINVFDSDEPYLVNGVGGGTIHGAVYIEKPDGTTCGYDSLEDDSPAVTGSGNTLTVYFVPQATTAHGWAYMTVSIFDDDGVELNTFGIDLFIDKKATATISADYWNLKSIEGLTAAVEGLTQQMVRSVNHATADTNGNVTLLPWQLPYSGVIGGQQVGDVEEALDGLARMQSAIIDQGIKDALINALSHVAWADEHGQNYIDALEQAMRSKLVSIVAVFDQGTAVIYVNDDLDTLRQYLTVTAQYSDSTTRTVTDYTLSGALTEGTSTITVSYGGKTTTFNVTVDGSLYQRVEWIETDGASRIDTGVAFDNTKDFVLTLEAEMSSDVVHQAGASVMTGWNAGGAVGVSFVASIDGHWTDGGSTPSGDSHLTGVDKLTTCEMTIEAGTATNTVSVFENETGTKTLTRTHPNIVNRIFLNTFPLFALSAQSNFTFTQNGFRIKSAIINQGGVTLRNMYACYRRSDNIIGFYDEITDTFFTNQGTGTFRKGDDI